MASDSSGNIVVPVWVDGDIVKPVVNDDGRIPVKIEQSTNTQDVDIVACSVTLPAQLKGSDVNIPIDIKACSITLPVQEQSPLTTIDVKEYGWYSGAWRKQPVIWGYSGTFEQDLSGVATAALYSAFITTPPAGTVYVIQSAYVRNITSAGTTHSIEARVATTRYAFLAYDTAMAIQGTTIFNGEVVVSNGRNIYVTCNLCTVGDTVYAGVWGYSLTVAA